MSDRPELRRDVLDKIGAGVVIVDPRTRRIEWANPMAATLLGASMDAVVGRRCHGFLCPGEEGQCPVFDHGKDVDSSERTLMRHDGTSLPIIEIGQTCPHRGRGQASRDLHRYQRAQAGRDSPARKRGSLPRSIRELARCDDGPRAPRVEFRLGESRDAGAVRGQG